MPAGWKHEDDTLEEIGYVGHGADHGARATREPDRARRALINGHRQHFSSGYSNEGWWTTNGDGVRGHAGAHHRMLSTYLNAVLRAGLEFEEFAEPPSSIPRYLIARCRRPR